jgi:hypothetical protein
MLASLLEKRSEQRSHDDLRNLAEEFNMDIDVLERLSRFVNVPTIREVKYELGKQGPIAGVVRCCSHASFLVLHTDSTTS